MEQTMKTLVEAAQEGDQQAIAQLYEKTSKKAYYLAKQLLKDEDTAQDILQDSYVKVFANLHMLRQPENFQGWLDTIVVNKSKDYLRKKKPMLFSQLSSDEEPDQELDFEDERDTFRPEAQVDYRETKRLIQAMIDALPEEQRMAVVLRYLEDMPVKRIAQIMECSEGTVKSRLNYGRKAIKAQVLELEKKGTKLYCMPLIPFLYWMFRQQALSAVVPASVGAGLSAFTGGAAAGSAQASGTAGASSGASGAAGASGTAGVSSGAAGSIGQGVAAGGVGKGVAAAAVKTRAAAAGKGIAMKAAAVAAAVCIGGGAAAGGVYLAKRSEPTVIEQPEEQEEREKRLSDENSGEIQETVEVDIQLSQEEMEALTAVCQAAKDQDYARLAQVFYESFDTLYLLSVDKFQGEYVLFDGAKLLPEVEGEGLLLRTVSRVRTSGNHEGETRYYLIGYYGEFSEGEPDGELLASSLSMWEYTGISNTISFSQAAYTKGEKVGDLEAQEWAKNDEGGWEWDTTATGDYNHEEEEFPYFRGNYHVSFLRESYLGDWLYRRAPDGELIWRMDDTEEYPPKLDFQIEVSSYLMYEESISTMGYQFSEQNPDGTGVYADETGQYFLPSTVEEVIGDMPIFWREESSSYDDGAAPFTGQPSAAESESGNQEAPETEAAVPQDETAALAAYREALESVLTQRKLPDGSDTDPATADMSGNQFAVYDVDGDGIRELFISYLDSANAWQQEQIYRYDPLSEQLKLEFSTRPGIQFYQNGMMKIDEFRNFSYGAVLWPYSVYQYNSASATFEYIGYVTCWEKDYHIQPSDGTVFPEDIDADGDGVVYQISVGSASADGEYVDLDQYNQWEREIFGGAQEITLPLMNLTQENIEKIQ